MRIFSGDRLFLTITLVLALGGFAIFSSAALGLLARESASVSRDILIQAGLGLGLGILALFVARSVPLAFIKRYAPWGYGATILFTALVFVPGVGTYANGATRWIDLGFITVQPAEFLKIGVVIMLAWWLSQSVKQLKDFKRGLGPFLAIIGLPAVILLLQPNTSTTLLIGATGAVMYFAAGAPWRDCLIIIALALFALGAVIVARPYVLERVMTFFDPSADPLNSSYQIQQSLIAVGSGGLLGRGFGQSVEKFNYLPEPDGDSVFAVFAEETGFVGAIILLGLFVGLAARGIVIAGESRELFGGLLALGFSSMLVLQAFINMGAMLGIIPLTGLPLPFVSHGGTALMVALIECGLILNVAAHRKN
ncbi:MAG: putative peptidoglycan glycosyltransferase FtsW [bacterium]|nr:putative peptidoglycan glycosyltransferase FtsW [bacterium]